MIDFFYRIKIQAFALCVAALLATTAHGAEPQWIFNHGDAGSRAMIGQGRVISQFGLFSIAPTGTDMTLNVGLREEEEFKASDRPFFALRYKATTKQRYGGLFFTNDDNLTTLSDKSYSQFEIQGDGKWHDLVVDMRNFAHKNWKGTITSFRLDPTNPSDIESRITISRMGFFATETDAADFLAAANDAPDVDHEAELANARSRCFLPKSVLHPDDSQEEYLVASGPETLDVPRETLVVATTGADGTVHIEPLCDVSSLGFATFCARGKGVRTIVAAPDVPQDAQGLDATPAIRFVVARGLMSADGGFRPNDALTAEEVASLKEKLASFKAYGSRGEKVADLADDFVASQTTRAEAATILTRGIRSALGRDISTTKSREYFERDRLRIGAWGNFQVRDYDEEYMRAYADCGFDFLLNLAVPSNRVLADADKYGVEVYVNDGAYLKPNEITAEYCDHPSYTGCFVTDEPGSDDYDKLAAKCNPYAATGKTPYVNLLPMYANAAQLKYGAGAAAIEYYDSDPNLFRKYCAAFCEKFNTKYICTDIYPLNWRDGKKFTYPEYVESINVIASVAREYDREFWCYIQTFGWIDSKRTPTEAEYRWQCYSMLSFGCKCILCWTYSGYNPKYPSLVAIDSSKTRAWYDARPVFWELRRLSDEFIQYRNLGAFTHNCTKDTPYLQMSNEYKDFDAIQEIDCAEPLLIGCFAKKDDSGARAFTLVNMTDFAKEQGATARIKLDGSKAIAWYRGVPQEVLPDDDGFFQFHLASGEGVFVTIQ